jgi:hypothetical protein
MDLAVDRPTPWRTESDAARAGTPAANELAHPRLFFPLLSHPCRPGDATLPAVPALEGHMADKIALGSAHGLAKFWSETLFAPTVHRPRTQ